jgi:hypothetical protein
VRYFDAFPPTHDFMIDNVVKRSEGVVHQLWGIKRTLEGVEELEEEVKAEVDEGEGENHEEEPEEVVPKHIIIPEVVREPRIKYFKVPKLGSFVAVKTSYNSCLSVEALDAAVENLKEIEVKRAEQAEEMKEWNDE